MTLTDEQKLERKRQRMVETARKYQLATYSASFVAPVFQRMIRAEAAAKPAGQATAIVDGKLAYVYRRVGECVCVTCGKTQAWSGDWGGMDTGHFLASRRASILFDESNVATQCARCNRFESGAQQQFRLWMLAVRGKKTVERLEFLKRTVVAYSREELVALRIEFAARLAAAEAKMTKGS